MTSEPTAPAFASMAAKRLAHGRSLADLQAAIDALLEGSTTEAGRDLLADELRIAHEGALAVGLYESCDGDDPMIEATHEALALTAPKIEQQLEFEALYGRDPSEQKEISAENLAWMSQHIMSHRELSAYKINRWLGFIHGVLAVRGRLSVIDEREATRSIFHRAYRAHRISPPKSASIRDSISFSAAPEKQSGKTTLEV
ncbi:hypothetical protein G6L37_05875 [Agrobacterium rubi]|nr:hypothetical protein [Agrobacterium rubi]NTF24888.1 hypothetical protein [Agrobacterium rubi]